MNEKLQIGGTQNKEVKGVISGIMDMKLQTTGKAVAEFMNDFYSEKYLKLRGRHLDADSIAEMMLAMNQYKDMFIWFIGDLAFLVDQMIFDGKITEYKSSFAFYQAHEKSLGISKTTWYDALTMRERFPDFEQFAEIGIKNVRQLVQIKDDKVFQKAVTQAAKSNYDEEKVKTVVAAFVQQEKDEKKTVKEKEEKKIRKEVLYDVFLKGKSMTLTAKNFPPEYLESAMVYFETAIKNYIARCMENEK